MFDVIAMGELIFDFSFYGQSERKNGLYEANPGGAPANVAVGAGRLGARTAFIGKIGSDFLSLGLKNTLEENGVNTSGLKLSDDFNTAMTFVQLDKNGDRSFNFYRSNSSDINILPEDICEDMILHTKIFHFGSLTLTDEPSRTTTICAVKKAHENQIIVSFDPNYRAALWNSEKEAANTIRNVLPYCDILKVSQEELKLISGTDDLETGMSKITGQYGIPLIFVTMGPGGSCWQYKGEYGREDAFSVHTIDTTGAGDSFVGAVLYKIACDFGGIKSLTAEQVKDTVHFASAASSFATTIAGAIPSLPDIEQVNSILSPN